MVGELAANEKALTQTGHEHRPLCRHVLHHEALGKEESLLLLLLKESLAEVSLAHGRICCFCTVRCEVALTGFLLTTAWESDERGKSICCFFGCC